MILSAARLSWGRLWIGLFAILSIGLLSATAAESADADSPVAPDYAGAKPPATQKQVSGDGPLAPDFAKGVTPETAAKLRVGVNPSGPPVIFLQGNKVSGIEADLATYLGESIGREVEFVQLPFHQLIPALLDNKIDIIMSGMSFTEMRAIRVNFSQPYMKVGQMPLVHRSELGKYSNTLGLLNTKGRVGVEKGTTGDLFVQENFIYAERVPYGDVNDAAKDLAAGKIDMVIDDSPIVWWLASENEDSGLAPMVVSLTEEYLAWAVRKDDLELLEECNTFLTKFRSSGDLHKVIKKWLPYATDL
ncbi:MAG: transporter substrate-binding domain-containing protein [Puniceicoccales bacterium]